MKGFLEGAAAGATVALLIAWAVLPGPEEMQAYLNRLSQTDCAAIGEQATLQPNGAVTCTPRHAP